MASITLLNCSTAVLIMPFSEEHANQQIINETDLLYKLIVR